jgi:hypothetical protein
MRCGQKRKIIKERRGNYSSSIVKSSSSKEIFSSESSVSSSVTGETSAFGFCSCLTIVSIGSEATSKVLSSVTPTCHPSGLSFATSSRIALTMLFRELPFLIESSNFPPLPHMYFSSASIRFRDSSR